MAALEAALQENFDKAAATAAGHEAAPSEEDGLNHDHALPGQQPRHE
jgi:hypothetical protein